MLPNQIIYIFTANTFKEDTFACIKYGFIYLTFTLIDRLTDLPGLLLRANYIKLSDRTMARGSLYYIAGLIGGHYR